MDWYYARQLASDWFKEMQKVEHSMGLALPKGLDDGSSVAAQALTMLLRKYEHLTVTRFRDSWVLIRRGDMATLGLSDAEHEQLIKGRYVVSQGADVAIE